MNLWPEEDLFSAAEAVDVLRSVGAADLAAQLGPEGSLRWLQDNEWRLRDCTVAELERLADGEDAEAVLGPHRATEVFG